MSNSCRGTKVLAGVSSENIAARRTAPASEGGRYKIRTTFPINSKIVKEFGTHSWGGVSKTALRFSLLDLGSSRVREKSGRPGDLRRTEWEPAGSLRVAGALPWNLPST